MARSKQVAHRFDEGRPKSATELGGKGAGLSMLARRGVPVPPGFIVETGVARAFAQHNRLPRRLSHQIAWKMRDLEQRTGKQFGSAEDPLIVSVRSGAAISMPGMMDTVLNLGLNPEIVEALVERHEDGRFAYDCYRRFLAMFAQVVLGLEASTFEAALSAAKERQGVATDGELNERSLEWLCKEYRAAIENLLGEPVPDDPWQQLQMAIVAVLGSWNNPRAVAYRRVNRISNNLGTAVTVQAMVFGNRDHRSGTGVVFSRNVATGAPGLYGEFLPMAQGEDVVAGARTPMPIQHMAGWNELLFYELKETVEALEDAFNDVVDVEFTIESGKLYILQVRNAKRTPEAAATIATHFVWEKRWTKTEALRNVSSKQMSALATATFNAEELAQATSGPRLRGKGLPASPGAAVGAVVLTADEAVRRAEKGEKVVLVRPDTCPDDLEGMLAAEAIVTMHGGTSCHAAVVARSLGKPAVVACDNLRVCAGETISVDGQTGVVVEGRLERAAGIDKKEVNLLLRWAGRGAQEFGKPELHFEYIQQEVRVERIINDFYMVEQMAESAKGTPLACQANRLMARMHREIADRIAMYLILAISGEVRHAFDSSREEVYIRSRSEMNTLRQEFGIPKSGSRDQAQRAVAEKLRGMSHEQHVEFARLVTDVFATPGWGGAFGGPAWAKISAAAVNYLTGKYNPTFFADHAFDLEHNGGCVFDKHYMLEGSGRRMGRQLEAKKYANGVPAMFSALVNCHSDFSPDVIAMVSKGAKLGIWSLPTELVCKFRRQHMLAS